MSQPVTRRQFLATTSAGAAAVWVPGIGARALDMGLCIHVPSAHRDSDPDLAALAARAVDAATAAGATYADARLTLTRMQNPQYRQDTEFRAVGVRALVNGCWGYHGSTVWTPDEMARLAAGAVAQARGNAAGAVRRIEWHPIPRVVKGQWTMPVKYDPFDIPLGEKLDFMNAAVDYAQSYMVNIGARGGMNFQRQQKVFASSEGSAWSQTLYRTSAFFDVEFPGESHSDLGWGSASADFFPIAGRGWEHIAESGLLDRMPQLIEDAKRNRPFIPMELGRYDVVFGGCAMATLLDQTLGAATELDRAMGYEANADGTSYLTDPLAMLGTEQVASPLVTVTANRSAPGGAATVRWDDESVVPEDFTLVKDGVLTDFQTTREQVAWLAPWYQKQGTPMRSHGCAGSESALYTTMQHTPNLTLQPGRTAATFHDLVAGVKKGLAVTSLGVKMDQQQLNGYGSGQMYEIKDGKLGLLVRGGTLLFRAPQLWKGVVAVGGPGSEQTMGFTRGKGEPRQTTAHSVSAVPAVVKQMTIIDLSRQT